MSCFLLWWCGGGKNVVGFFLCVFLYKHFFSLARSMLSIVYPLLLLLLPSLRVALKDLVCASAHRAQWDDPQPATAQVMERERVDPASLVGR